MDKKLYNVIMTIKKRQGGYMDCLEEIIKKIGSCKNGNIRVNFKELKEAVALEEELKRR